MKNSGLDRFSKGQSVQLTDGILHKQYAWQYGTVEKVIKSRNMVSVVLESGDRYDAFPQNVIACDLSMNEAVEQVPEMKM